jgi:hypothetical protein
VILVDDAESVRAGVACREVEGFFEWIIPPRDLDDDVALHLCVESSHRILRLRQSGKRVEKSFSVVGIVARRRDVKRRRRCGRRGKGRNRKEKYRGGGEEPAEKGKRAG